MQRRRTSQLQTPLPYGRGSDRRGGRRRHAACGQRSSHCSRNARSAFTLTELLIVIAVIGLLVGLIVTGVSAAVGAQKRAYTQQILRSTALAAERFAEDNPLRMVYDKRDGATFGPYPPYQLDRNSVVNVRPNVARIVSGLTANSTPWAINVEQKLLFRLARDLLGYTGGSPSAEEVSYTDMTDDNSPARRDDDNRALYTYLRALTPDAVAQVPANAIQPLTYPKVLIDPANQPPVLAEFVNTGDLSVAAPELSRTEILGIHDAWGVPLDYMLYVKIEWDVNIAAYRVTERRPAFRSRGVAREQYDLWLQDPAGTNALFNQPQNWLWSEPLPRPYLDIEDPLAGTIHAENPPSIANGWSRAAANMHAADDYKYLPKHDLQSP
ncbi:MAG: prepilin-type N-terminal cleavage/methylation domain-containing protein [Phycisphaerae bacterium]|jgi:prepilin-type N-terminal cleavage/methylation domain-containing protein